MLPLTTMLVFGPYRQNRFGKFGIVMPRYARGSPFHCCLQIDATLAFDLHRPQERLARNPVP